MSLVRRAWAALCAAALVALAVLPVAASAEPLVFAAVSLKEAMDSAAAAWTRRAGTMPVVSYAGSAALARQIEQGAPADVFVSADEDWMDRLERRGLLKQGSRGRLVGNSLVLVAPVAGPGAPPMAAVQSLRLVQGVRLADALGADGRLALADVAAVPAGRYARAALESLGAWTAVSGRLAQAENVRAALTLVARGEAPLGIVYATDARAEPRVRVIGAFPAGSHPPIVYPVAVLAGARSPRAREFVDFLRSPDGLAVFAAHGFAVAR